MTRIFAALALASFSIVASAADKPLPVTVENSVLSVRDADNPARISVTETVTLSDRYTVPSGKRLVIEFVSGTSTITIGGDVVAAVLVAGTDHYLEPKLMATSATNKHYVVSQLTRLYADEGSDVYATHLTLGTGSASTRLTFTGYLVDL